MAFSSPVLLLLLSLSTLLHVSSPSPTPAGECFPMNLLLRTFKLSVSNCSFTLKDKQKEAIQADITVVIIPILYLVAFVIGLPANALALWVLLFRTKKLPGTVLLVNLTACDLLLLLVLPFRIAYHFNGNHWVFGEPLCRVVTALFYGNMYGSVLSLALVAADRYVALVHPFGAKTLRSSRASLYLSLAVWAAMGAAMAPLLAARQSYPLSEPPITTCHDALPEQEQESFFRPYFSTLFAAGFLLPLAIVLFCYGAVIRTLAASGQRYAHAVRVTALSLAVFMVCLLPSNVLLLLHYTDSYLVDDSYDLYMPYMVSLAVSTFNSCLDPFIFYYVSDDFRHKLRAALSSCRGGKQQSSSSSSGNQVSYSSSGNSSSRSKITLLSAKSSRVAAGMPSEGKPTLPALSEGDVA